MPSAYVHYLRFKRSTSTLLLLILILSASLNESRAQSPFSGLEPLFTEPRNYVAYFAENGPFIDGDLRDSVWEEVSWSKPFIDIEGDQMPRPPLETRMKMMWNDTCLFIAAELQEPHVWATLEDHDQVVYYDNDFEVFIDPSNDTHQYFEIEVNAFNTIFDLFMPKPYRNGSGALISWDANKMRTAVQVQGKLNDASQTDKGWTVEMAIPFSSVTIGNNPRIPEEGSFWRINFSRVQWDTHIEDGKYVKVKGENGKPLPEHNWVWSPQGVINMHFPERWGYLLFTRKKVGSPAVAFNLPYAEKQKPYLWLIYYKEKEYYKQHGRYASSLTELDLQKQAKVVIDGHTNLSRVEATDKQFLAIIQGPDKQEWSVNQEGLIQKLR